MRRSLQYRRRDLVPNVAKREIKIRFVAALVKIASGLADIDDVDSCCFISHLGGED